MAKALTLLGTLLGNTDATEQELIAALEIYDVAPDDNPGDPYGVRYAAADLLTTEAMNMARKSAITSVEDISLDRRRVTNALLTRAAALRGEADSLVDDGHFSVTEFHPERGGVSWI